MLSSYDSRSAFLSTDLMTDKITCPHCNVPLPPRWKASNVICSDPGRESEISVGTTYTTTCMSCDKALIEFEPATDGPLAELGRTPVFPVPKDEAIEVVVRIVLDFENLRRRGKDEPEMTPEEREEQATTLRDRLRTMKDAVTAEAYMRTTQGLSLVADTAQITQVFGGILGDQ